jgi:prepilin-type N-terminal cleavage/methylation domain-containing protein
VRKTVRRPAGFSLLEVLVTIAVFALLFAVLMGGWFQALNAQSRLADTARQVQQQQHFTASMRQLMAEALSPLPSRGVVFDGTAEGFTLESTASLAPGLGSAPVPVTLRFEKTVDILRVRVGHAGRTAVALPWRFRTASLRYLDGELQSHDRWPPPSTTSTAGPAAISLPTLVQLDVQFEGAAQAVTLLLAPRSSATPLPEPSSPISLPTQ